MGTRLTLTTIATPTVGESSIVQLSHGEVVVRGMTKAQMQEMRRAAQKPDGDLDTDVIERELFRLGVVDPPMAEAEEEVMNAILNTWSQRDFDAVIKEVMRLNGTDDDFNKAQVAAFRPE